MEDIFITEFFELDNEFEELGVFDSIINRDSPFFINLLRLRVCAVMEFQDSYERINDFYRQIMILLKGSKAKGTLQRIFVYVKVGHPKRDEKLEELHKERLKKEDNPPELFIIDAQKQTSASKR